MSGSDHECFNQASSCVCCFCCEGGGKSAFALALTTNKTEDALITDEATDVNLVSPAAETLFPLYSCCCTNCSIYREIRQWLKCSNKGACLCYEGSGLCRITFEDPTIYRFAGALGPPPCYLAGTDAKLFILLKSSILPLMSAMLSVHSQAGLVVFDAPI